MAGNLLVTSESESLSNASDVQVEPPAQPDQVEAKVSGQWRWALAVFPVLAAVSLFTHYPYFGASFVLDDVIVLNHLGMVKLDRMPYTVYMVVPHFGQVFAGWKIWLNGMVNVWGVETTGFHVGNSLMQAISGVLLAVLMRRYSPSSWGPLLAAFLWAGASFGNLDNPMLWVAAGVYPAFLCWILLAMLFLTGYATRFSRWCAVGMSVSLIIGFFIESPAILFGLLLPLQWLLLERKRATADTPLFLWIGLGLGVFSVLMGGHLFVTYLCGAGGLNNPVTLVVRGLILQFAAAFGNLFLWSPTDPAMNSEIRLKAVAMTVMVACWALLAEPKLKRLTITFFVVVSLISSAILASRDPSATFMGRYLYLHTLIWSIAAGATVEGVVPRRGSTGRKAMVTLLAAMAGVFVATQWSMAKYWRTEFDKKVAPEGNVFLGYLDLFQSIAEDASASGKEARLVDFPLATLEYLPICLPASSFAAVAFPRGLPSLEFIPPDRATKEDVDRSLILLANSSAAYGPVARFIVEKVYPDVAAMLWLSKFGERQGVEVSLDGLAFRFPVPRTPLNINFSAKEALAFFFERRPPGLGVANDDHRELMKNVVAETKPLTAFDSLLADLQRSDDPMAARWLAIYEQRMRPYLAPENALARDLAKVWRVASPAEKGCSIENRPEYEGFVRFQLKAQGASASGEAIVETGPFTLRANTEYAVVFRARGDRDGAIVKAAMVRADANQAPAGLSMFVPLSSQWEYVRHTFRATASGPAYFRFLLGAPSQFVDVAELSILPTK